MGSEYRPALDSMLRQPPGSTPPKGLASPSGFDLTGFDLTEVDFAATDPTTSGFDLTEVDFAATDPTTGPKTLGGLTSPRLISLQPIRRPDRKPQLLIPGRCLSPPQVDFVRARTRPPGPIHTNLGSVYAAIHRTISTYRSFNKLPAGALGETRARSLDD
jgi:hypothetical protein